MAQGMMRSSVAVDPARPEEQGHHFVLARDEVVKLDSTGDGIYVQSAELKSAALALPLSPATVLDLPKKAERTAFGTSIALSCSS